MDSYNFCGRPSYEPDQELIDRYYENLEISTGRPVVDEKTAEVFRWINQLTSSQKRGPKQVATVSVHWDAL